MKGVRQGCALSPSLYAIFTVWVFDQLGAITFAEWAFACVTLFADDSHLCWTVESLTDRDFVCQCTTAPVFCFRLWAWRSIGPNRIVLRLRGNKAKRRLRMHEQRTAQAPVMSVGAPQNPLHIPKAKSMTYLVIVASYKNFELQTCRHRLTAAMQKKHRLIKVLHSSSLSLKCRIRCTLPVFEVL